MDFKSLVDKIKKSPNNKNISNLLIVVLVLVLISVAISAFRTPSYRAENKEATKVSNIDQIKTQNNNPQDERVLEDKLKSTLELIQGVGKVETMVYFEGGEEKVPAMNITDSTNSTEEKDNEGGTRNTTEKNSGNTVVLTNEGDKTSPLIVKTYKPKVCGVIVVAEGAGEKVVEYKITQAVTNLFDITADKVNVYAMKK